MKPQIVHDKEKKIILERLKNLASSYTPDWKPDFNDPDFGSAMALIFRDMYDEQVDRLNKLPDKQRRDLVNLLSPIQMSPRSSKGYVTFEMSEGATEGLYLEKGFQLLADGNDSNEVHFETMSPLYVSPSRLQKAIVYDHEYGWYAEQTLEPSGIQFSLFEVSESDNRNKPYFVLHDENWLHFRSGMRLGVQFITENQSSGETLHEALASTDKVRWFVEEEETQINLTPILGDDLWLWFQLADNQSVKGRLHCKIIDIPAFRDIKIDDIRLKIDVSHIQPETLMLNDEPILSDNAGQQLKKRFVVHTEDFIKPYGEAFNVFDALLIGDKDIFMKPGAQVTLEIDLLQERKAIVTENDEEFIKWRHIMHESELREPEPKTVRIDKLQWEYWNGIGWMPLKVNREANTIPEKGIWSISFVCPHDMSSTIFGPTESPYIRARITHVLNAFAPRGDVAVPVIRTIRTHISSSDTELTKASKRLDFIDIYANGEVDYLSSEQIFEKSFPLIPTPDTDISKVVYLSLTQPLKKGPIRFEVTPNFKIGDKERISYKIQYYGRKDGQNNWYDLPHEDETKGFIKNGLISFMAPANMLSLTRFGTTSYWIRLCPIYEAYQEKYGRDLNMRINAIKVEQKETLSSEYHSITTLQPWTTITLSRNPILEAEVWINEIDTLNESEIKKLKEIHSDTVHEEYDKNGVLIALWRKWTQVEKFSEARFIDGGRAYKLDLEQGVITFGNGKLGRIPQSTQPEFIRIDYALGGGLQGNVSENTISKAVSSLPFLDRVYNGASVWGGLPKEGALRAETRISERLRHRGSALTSRDIKAIVMSENRDLHDARVSMKKGMLTLSIIPKVYPYHMSHFYEIKERIEDILKKSMSCMVTSQERIEIREPQFVAYSVNMDVVVNSADEYIRALSRWSVSLDKYFNPMHWSIGQLPDHTFVLSDLKQMLEGTEQIENVMIQIHLVDGENRIPLDATEMKRLEHVIPITGIHDIRVKIRG